MDGDVRPADDGGTPIDAASRPRPRPIRAGMIAAVLWVSLGLVAAWVSAQAGAPQLSGSLALLSAVPALLIAGRVNDLHVRSDWISAVVVAGLSAAVIGGAVAIVASILMYG